jgi:glyoxylase-like metal-dependent hydrolase (beta-lactamase superfamily II)
LRWPSASGAARSRAPSSSALLLVDTGNFRARDKTFVAVRGWEAAPLAAAVYTHGHVDHACGLPPFLAEAVARGSPRPRIVAPVSRARTLAAAGDLSLASHLIDWAVTIAPRQREAHRLRAEIYEARPAASPALMTRGRPRAPSRRAPP